MDAPALVAALSRTPSALEALFATTTADDSRWRPADGGWSLREIVGHLLAEETGDFRARLRSTLEDPARPWETFDPEATVRERGFQDQDLAALLAAFRAERARSVAWLETLASPAWDAAHQPRRGGPLHAGDLLASWAAHDARHLQQIAKRLHGLAARHGAPYDVGYAG